MDNYNNKPLFGKIALLESQLDQLETEFSNLQTLLIQCGFPEGIKTLKETAIELLNEKNFINKSTKKNYY